MERTSRPSEASMESVRAKKKRGNLPKEAVNILRTWLRNHLQNAYPCEKEKLQLVRDTGLTLEQVSNWFINARRRVWPGMLKRSGQNPEDFRITRRKRPSKVCNNSLYGTHIESDSSNDVHPSVIKLPRTSTYPNIWSECRTAENMDTVHNARNSNKVNFDMLTQLEREHCRWIIQQLADIFLQFGRRIVIC